MRGISLAIMLLVFIVGKSQNNYTQYVNPMIGTGGHGHTFPGATRPFAMVQLSPDTRIDGSWDGCSGYHYSDSVIYGFSHTHLSGTGCSDYGDIMIMPKMGEGTWIKESYASTFKHATEKANAGFYAVRLEKSLIDVRLTTTTRVGLHEYTFNEAGKASILLDLQHRDELLAGSIRVIDSQTIEGFRRSKAWAADQLVYYRIQFSKPFITKHVMSGDNWDYWANFNFDVKKGESVYVKVSISSVDEAGAKANMDKELPHWNFEKVKAESNTAWNLELNRIKAYGGTKAEKINFYTALYHCMIHPNVMNDVDGRYRGRDKQIHKAEGFDYYTVFSLWDTHRALHPLLNIIDKKRSHDFIMTFKAQFEQSGRLPMWELWGNETDCMIGFHSVSVILDAYNKGVISRDELEDIYPAVTAEAMSNRFGLDKFRAKGFLSIEDESESVSKTLEYSYDYYCVSEMAEIMGIPDEAAYFRKLSKGWQNVYDFNTGFVRPRKNGGWLEPFDPKQVNNHFTEANAWQYSFAFPHSFESMRNDIKIAQLFNADTKTTGREQSDITGLIGQYAQGNEPSHHIPYMFTSIDSTVKYVKKVCKELYKPTPDGLCGNEDCGQMSAWYVFSAMGFYPVNPSSNKFKYGNMIFDSVFFKSGNVTVSYYRNPFISPKYYNKSDKFFGKYGKSSDFNFDFEKDELYHGYGYAISCKKGFNRSGAFISSPIISAKSMVFKDSLQIEFLKNTNQRNLNDTLIFYTLNGTDPNKNSTQYTFGKKLIIDQSLTIKALYISNSGIPSSISTAYFYKRPNNYTIKINSIYNKQYTADGDDGLIDGLLGDTDWRKGRWQGYQNQNFEAVVDLQETKTIKSINTGFLQDTRSWILMPKNVTYYGSVDGINFEKITTVENTVADSNYTSQRKEFICTEVSKQYRYIKVTAINYGLLPPWHQGAGGDAFIFIDEISILTTP